MYNGRPSARKSFPSPAALPRGQVSEGVDPTWDFPGRAACGPTGLAPRLPGACGVPGPWWLRVATPPASDALGAPSGLCIVQTGRGLGGPEHPPNGPDTSLRACALALPGSRQSPLSAERELCLSEMVRLSKGQKPRKEGGGVGWGCWSLRAVPRVSAMASTLCNNSKASGRLRAWDPGFIAP